MPQRFQIGDRVTIKKAFNTDYDGLKDRIWVIYRLDPYNIQNPSMGYTIQADEKQIGEASYAWAPDLVLDPEWACICNPTLPMREDKCIECMGRLYP